MFGCGRLVDAADEGFEVAGFGEGEDFGMIGGCGAGFEELDTAVGVSCRGGDDFREVLQGNVMRAGVGDESAAG